MSWYCPTELTLANPIQTPYPCCVFGIAPINNTIYATQQLCQDNTSCCNNANQPGTSNLDSCCGGLDQGEPCNYSYWLSLLPSARDAICQYCTSSTPGPPCDSEVSLYCRCCDGCNQTTTTTTTIVVNRGVKMCPQFGTLEFMATATGGPTLYAIVWSYPIGTILELDVTYVSFFDGSITHYRACWEIIEFTANYVCAEADGTLINPTPVTCKSCTIPPGDVCTTTTLTTQPPNPYWCVEKCCDGSIYRVEVNFPYDWTAIISGMVPGTVFLAQSWNNLNGTGLQECYKLIGPPCSGSPLITLSPPVWSTQPGAIDGCNLCLTQYECNQVGDIYQWFPPTLPPPAGQPVDTGMNGDLCLCTTTSTTSSIYGCTDPTACNYDPTAIIDDGSCILPDGCTDSQACNYDPNAICDDGSCVALVYGCMDGGNCVGTNCPNAGSCTNPTGWFTSPYPGCEAYNYYAGAQIDLGTCFGYCNCLDPNGANYNFTGEIGVPPPSLPTMINGLYIDCAGALQMNINTLQWNGNVGDTSCCGAIVTTTTTVCVFGCTDATSFNYDPSATCEDGSCIAFIYGCMDGGCCTTGIAPDPLVGDTCTGGFFGVYGLCPMGGPNAPSYNSPIGPPGASNYYPGANLDDGSCL